MRAIAAYRGAGAAPGGANPARPRRRYSSTLAAEHSGVGRDDVAQTVARWIDEAPLTILPRVAQPVLNQLLLSLRCGPEACSRPLRLPG